MEKQTNQFGQTPSGDSRSCPFPGDPPYLWPEARFLEGIRPYDFEPPFSTVASPADAVFGIVSAPSSKGIAALECWKVARPALKARLIFAVYPACGTRQEDLSRLRALRSNKQDIEIRVKAYDSVADRPPNTLCFWRELQNIRYLVTGQSEDFGFDRRSREKINFVFRAEPRLVEAFRRYFDWLWTAAVDITHEAVTRIPFLVLPSGTEEAAQLWRAYSSSFGTAGEEPKPETARVDPQTGDVTIVSGKGEPIAAPTEQIGVTKWDRLADAVTSIYEKGDLATIERGIRIPQLDIPFNPEWLGDRPAIQTGGVVRTVNMRIRVIHENELAGIKALRDRLRSLLREFTFGLAEHVRWMPHNARKLFDSEMERLNNEVRNSLEISSKATWTCLSARECPQ